MARKPSPAPKRPYVRVTRWRRRRFFALLEETGTVKVAAELAGLGIGAIYRLRKLEPGVSGADGGGDRAGVGAAGIELIRPSPSHR